MKSSLEARGRRVNQTEGMPASRQSLFRRFSNVLEPFSPESQTPAFEWEIENDDLLLRAKGSDLNIVWAYLGRRDLGMKLQKLRTQRTTGNRVRGAFRSRRLWRMWPLESGETAFLRGEFGLIRFAGERRLVRFEMPTRAFQSALQALEASEERLDSLFQQLQLDEDSDFNAARRWHEKHRDEWDSLEFQRGSREELEAILKAMAPLLLDPKQPYYWIWNPSIKPDCSLLDLRRPFPSYILYWNKSCQIAAERIGALMDEEFEVHMDTSRWRGYDLRGDPAGRVLPQLRFTDGTMHERMEALLSLRDFLRDKLPPEEIAALLTPFAT